MLLGTNHSWAHCNCKWTLFYILKELTFFRHPISKLHVSHYSNTPSIIGLVDVDSITGESDGEDEDVSREVDERDGDVTLLLVTSVSTAEKWDDV